MTVDVTSHFEVITPRILLLCQEGSSLWRGKGPGANDDQDNYQSVTNSQSASCILSWVPSVEQNCGRFMDKMRIIKRICSIDCILNDQCDDGITLTLSCVFIFYIFNSISSPGPGYGLTPLLLCYSTLPQDTHPLSGGRHSPLVTRARAGVSAQYRERCDAELSLLSRDTQLFGKIVGGIIRFSLNYQAQQKLCRPAK